MKSSFDIGNQNKSLESKIVVALERVSEAFRVLLWNESKENNLSPIQIQLLIFILFHEQAQCKVSYLAQEFNLTKATISESVRVLLQKQLIRKQEDPHDTRSQLIELTEEGKSVAKRSASFAFAIERPLSSLSKEQKQVMFSGLLKLIQDLNQAGIITVKRMCYTCQNYALVENAPYCRLLAARLEPEDLRLDCPEHHSLPD